MNSFYWFHLLFLFILLLPVLSFLFTLRKPLRRSLLAILLVQAAASFSTCYVCRRCTGSVPRRTFLTSMESWISGGRIPQSYSFPSTIPSFSRRGFA